MLEVVSWYMIALITHFLDCYIFAKFTNERFKISLKMIILIFTLSVIDCYLGVENGLFKILITNFLTFAILKFLYKKSVSKTLLGTLFISIGYAIAEIVYALFLYLVLFNIFGDNFIEGDVGLIITNIVIFINYIVLVNIKKVSSFVSSIINWCDDKKFLRILCNIILAIIICAIIMYPLSYNELNHDQFMILFAMLIGILIFIVGYFSQKSTNNQLTTKYDELLEYVKDYEVEVVEKGKAIHEHKNQLAVIDGMIPTSNKKLKKYVEDKIENLNKLDDNVWLEKLTNLPEGGIKGLVYLKIKKMLDNNIAIFIDVDDNLKNKNKWENVNNNLEDYTKILGVYLDNAIEATLDTKDKQIIIEFIDNKDNVEFILSNTYKGKINFEEIDNEKFSTKGKNRGYGLSLVKDIIEKNKNIEQKRELNGKFYVQKLTIKK